MQVVVANPDVGAGGTVTEGDTANAASEAVDVVKEPQALDNHRGASSCIRRK